ncbi:pectate lyase-like [Magnolia sinica]|uniref:pectate lyase-like n=1 Tax=Magnolia sinica TaxID=86752 RepID=UPI002658850E|nr:pectate lyase-like [Magnolia sinica]
MDLVPSKPYLSFFFFLFLAGIPVLYANIGDFDEFWRKQSREARASALSSYEPFPDEVADSVIEEVHLSLKANNTRRELRQYKGKCEGTNPIDRCWRCDKHWDRHRKRLAKCVLGFGCRTIGGRNSRIYVVTDASDNDVVNPKRGTLRWGVIQKKALWIIFARSMIITLKEELIFASHKTVDGRGHNVRIAYGAGFTLQYVKNIIIHNIYFHDTKSRSGGMVRDSLAHVGFRTVSDGDAISIYGSNNIWIDHNSLSRGIDGLIDVIEGCKN